MRGFWSHLEPPLVVLDVLRRSSTPPTNFKAFMFTISAMSVLSALGNATLGSSVSSRGSIVLYLWTVFCVLALCNISASSTEFSLGLPSQLQEHVN